jgi:hypothetical protein
MTSQPSGRVTHNGATGTGRREPVVGVACVAGTALLVVTPPFVVDNYGIVQRLFIAVLFGWPLAAALMASRVTAHG